MFKSLVTVMLCAAGLALGIQHAVADPLPITETKPAPVKKKFFSKKPKKPAPVAAVDENPIGVDGFSNTDFNCELGNKITIYEKAEDNQHIVLLWQKHVHKMTRVDTTTGANRFENPEHGLVWIGIPAKGMLLDSKQGHQLANECRNAEQMKPVAAKAPELIKPAEQPAS